MDKAKGFAGGAALLVGGFVWIVFDNLALGILAGLVAGAGGFKAAAKRLGGGDR
ncbi:MAG: hypothetical protein INF91_08685 [Alphaproteobacteria bacterium]|nr:hypothetical protein [Alphaproteobacteria bacterium]